MINKLAQVPHTIPGNIRGLGEYGLEGLGAEDAPSRFNQFISYTVGLLTVIAGIYFFFILITGAIQWISSGGDKAKVSDARDRVTMGVIGMIVVVAAIFIVQIAGDFLGFPGILDPANIIIQRLSP